MAQKPRKVVLSFESRRERREGERIRSLRAAYLKATDEQVRAAERLEGALRALEEASLAAERTAWALTVAERRRIDAMSFEALMMWLADVCKVRNGGEHFCIADLIRAKRGDESAADAAGADG
jgi:hypothetical protein